MSLAATRSGAIVLRSGLMAAAVRDDVYDSDRGPRSPFKAPKLSSATVCSSEPSDMGAWASRKRASASLEAPLSSRRRCASDAPNVSTTQLLHVGRIHRMVRADRLAQRLGERCGRFEAVARVVCKCLQHGVVEHRWRMEPDAARRLHDDVEDVLDRLVVRVAPEQPHPGERAPTIRLPRRTRHCARRSQSWTAAARAT